MWSVLGSATPDGAGAFNSVDHIQYAMSTLAERRNMRDLQQQSIPPLPWLLLVIGRRSNDHRSALGNDKKWLHYCQVGSADLAVVTADASHHW